MNKTVLIRVENEIIGDAKYLLLSPRISSLDIASSSTLTEPVFSQKARPVKGENALRIR
jgi:hypothetical protein